LNDWENTTGKGYPDTINDVPAMRHHIELVVNGIISDYPDVLRSVAEAF
jgi:hypothetical protein